MQLTDTQKTFILFFVEDGEHDFARTCQALRVRRSEANRWFLDAAFQDAIHVAHARKLARRGYGPLLALEDMHAIAHSDIGLVQYVDGEQGLMSLPRHVRVAISKVKFKTACKQDGELFVYPCEITMHSKQAALDQIATWYGVADRVKGGAVQDKDAGPKRISGIVLEPPLTQEDLDNEELLR